MRQKGTLWGLIGAIALTVLILDSKTALQSGSEAVQMCISALIPSLFPFFVFTPMVTRLDLPICKPLCSLLRLPEQASGILLTGFLGGYPTGAQAVSDAVKGRFIQPEDGRRMMAFCSNAGPAFLFGIGSQLFFSIKYCWLIWGIHILSAIIVGILTPGSHGTCISREATAVSLPEALKKGIVTMGMVCGWVVLFRVLLTFCQRWFLWLLPVSGQVLFSGLVELANGCLNLSVIPCIGQRLTYFSLFLGFGGICVWLQTISVSQGADTSLYLPGKIMQCMVTALLCAAVQLLIPAADRYYLPGWVYGIGVGICVIYGLIMKKTEKRCGNYAAVGV